MKLTINVFLLKSGRTIYDALSDEHAIQPQQFEIDDTSCLFYYQTNPSKPKWVDLFNDIDQIDTTQMRGRSLQGVLVLAVNDRVFCFTFGHARHLIEKASIERYFGLRTALSMTDPQLIKSIDKSNIDKIPLRSRSQSSKNLSISEFEFKFDSEILKSLTGIVESTDGDDHEIVSGSDSLSLHTDVQLAQLPAIAERLITAYEDERGKEKYPWMDHIVPVRDDSVSSALDELLVSSVNQGLYNEIWIAAPRIIEYEGFSGFSYTSQRGRNGNGPVVGFELDLQRCLMEKALVGNLSVEVAKSTKIYLYGTDYNKIDTWTLYECLSGEVELAGENYLLSEGDWYRIDRDYASQVNHYFNVFPRSDIVFPRYNGAHEGDYLRSISDGVVFHLLDQHNVRVNGASSVIEFCDLLTSDNHIVHVKKYSSSSVLSHLFSQAYVSAESLIHAPEIIEQVNAHLASQGTHTFDFNPAAQPRHNHIIFAIMQSSQGALHMPFFSKVNFRQYSQRLVAMGYHVELAKIDI
ncbi:sporadically distributed protein, TIGR04141 family [Pseudomonas chlororaphis]|uniref:TIGR04141 family sporadically distributed protein n=1 Tax=Pseudomonas chlororaphis TaxID=587753 RepID=A0AAP9VXG1_9PSED|nr:TIGR04141 family sporadically distributed protein [Pseudomonas chlororaphis]AUG39673.1 sporadically distributed protein, TIGR04141 family [Pseudomonas chlororaphis]QNR49267.1 TIGR04141 family sporadically distributed protein [Pseudomonas chlororaphis]